MGRSFLGHRLAGNPLPKQSPRSNVKPLQTTRRHNIHNASRPEGDLSARADEHHLVQSIAQSPLKPVEKLPPSWLHLAHLPASTPLHLLTVQVPWRLLSSCRPRPPTLPYLGEVEPVQRVALLFHPLHRSSCLLHPLSLLGQVEVEHGHSSGADVRLGQGVDHQHHPDGPLAFPIAGDGIEEVVGIEPLAPLVRGHPVRQHELDVLQVPLEAAVQFAGQHVLQVLPMGQHLTAGQAGDGVGIGEVQLEVHARAGLESGLGVLRDEVPHPRVGHVDGAEQVGRGVPSDGPQEGVQVSLLGKEGRDESGQRCLVCGTQLCMQPQHAHAARLMWGEHTASVYVSYRARVACIYVYPSPYTI